MDWHAAYLDAARSSVAHLAGVTVADPPIPSPYPNVIPLYGTSVWTSVSACPMAFLVVPAMTLPGLGAGYDDVTAINWALSTYPSAEVRLVNGLTYAAYSPVQIPAGGVLRGVSGNVASSTDYAATLSAQAGWSQGTAPLPAMVNITGEETKIIGVNLDGQNVLPTGVHGIAASGVSIGLIRDVHIFLARQNGIDLSNGNTWRLVRVHIGGGGLTKIGFNLGVSDSNLIDCLAGACLQPGYQFSACNNMKLTGCRSEFNQIGYEMNWGTGQTGMLQLANCSTDRNQQHGIDIAALSNMPILISNMMLRRDGSSSTSAGYAGVNVQAAATAPVILSNVVTAPGVNDNGTGNLSPQYGISISPTPTYVSVTSGFFHAATAGVNGTISNFRAVATRTGGPSTPSAITLVPDSA